MLTKVALATATSAAALLLASAASAASYTYNFTGGSSASTGPFGNVLNFSSAPSGGPNLTATAYYATNSSSAVGAAYLGHYSTGLGVTNPGVLIWPIPPIVIPDGEHEVDNSGLIDLVLFQFAAPIDITSISLTSFGDADIQAWFGNSFAGGSINGDFGMTDLGTFTCNSSCNGSPETVSYDVDPSGTMASYLLIAAKPGDDNDQFKIRELVVNYNTPTTDVSEPGTLAAFGIGLAALGYLGRRRKSA